jgi:hypothetical protein
VPVAAPFEQLEPSRVQLAVEVRDEVDRFAGEDLPADRAGQNCASSVEPASASVELSPLETACATLSK